MIVQPSCVQMAVSAVNESCAVRATRKLPALACTSAAPPTEPSAELESIVTMTALPATLPPMTGSDGAELGDVALPPHACRSDPIIAAENTSPARTQNSRRDRACRSESSNTIFT